MRNNPWLVTSVTDLSYYCCPECQYRSQNLEKFKIHALNNHARANDLFNRDEDEYFAKIIKDENQDEHFEHQDNYHHFDDTIPPEEEDLEDKPLKPKKPKLAKPFKCQECDYRATKVRNIKVATISLQQNTFKMIRIS